MVLLRTKVQETHEHQELKEKYEELCTPNNMR
jgi:hypothetical protein